MAVEWDLEEMEEKPLYTIANNGFNKKNHYIRLIFQNSYDTLEMKYEEISNICLENFVDRVAEQCNILQQICYYFYIY